MSSTIILLSFVFALLAFATCNPIPILLNSDDLLSYGSGEITNIEETIWTITILRTEGTAISNHSTNKIIMDCSRWLILQYFQIQFNSQSAQYTSSLTDIPDETEWIRVVVLQQNTTGLQDGSVQMVVRCDREISFAQKNLQPSKFFKGTIVAPNILMLTFNETIVLDKLLEVPDSIELTFKNSAENPAIEIQVEPIPLVMFYIGTQHITFFNYWQVSTEQNESEKVFSSQCYVKFTVGKGSEYATGTIDFIKESFTGTLWIEQIWNGTSSYVKVGAKTLPNLKSLESFDVGYQYTEKPKFPNKFLQVVKWNTIHVTPKDVKYHPDKQSIKIPFDFGSMTTLRYGTNEKTRFMQAFKNERRNVLTITSVGNLCNLERHIDANIHLSRKWKTPVPNGLKISAKLDYSKDKSTKANTPVNGHSPPQKIQLSFQQILITGEPITAEFPVNNIFGCLIYQCAYEELNQS